MQKSNSNWLNRLSVSVSIVLLAIFTVSALSYKYLRQIEDKPKPVVLMEPKTDEISGRLITTKIELPPPPTISVRPLIPTTESPRKNPSIQPMKPSVSIEMVSNKEKEVSLGIQKLKPGKTKPDQNLSLGLDTPKRLAKQKNEMEGRVLLRMLEHDKGPHISFAWPENSSLRERLFTKFKRCFDMRVALMNSDGKLYRLKEKMGNPWSINLDNYSGFVRRPEGETIVQEEKILNRIRRHHKTPSTTPHVRVFPRWLDAVLLGQLKSLIGSGYIEAINVEAKYEISDSAIIVTGVRVDGRIVQGGFQLPSQRNC